MNGRYCKNMRCSEARKGKPCTAYEHCDMFLWDIEKEKGNKPTSDLNGVIPLESQEQEEFAAWCDAKGLLWFHIPNERKATVRVMVELERNGLKKGVPDNFIAEPSGKYHGLFIELKRAKKSLSRKSVEQRRWIKALAKKGYKAVFCYGAEEAKRVVCEYLED